MSSQPVRAEFINKNMYPCISTEVPNLEEGEKTLILSMDTYIGQVLYISTINLFLYWIIYGVIISCRFGSSCDMCFLAISLPHTTYVLHG